MGKLSLFAWALAIAMPITGFADNRASCAMLLQAIPLHAQETDYTCGAACTRSLLQYFKGQRFSEEQIAQVLGTYLLGYTPARNIQNLFAHFSLNSQIDSGLSLHDLRGCLARGEAVIVLVTQDSDPHYAVLSAIDATHVTLMDPWVARDNIYSRMSIAEFERKWTFTLNGQTLRHSALRVWSMVH